MIGAITRMGDAGVRTALHDAANPLLTRATKFSTLKPGPWTSSNGGACGGGRWRWRVSWPRFCVGSGLTGRRSSGARTPPQRPPHNAEEAHGPARGRRGSVPTRSRLRDAANTTTDGSSPVIVLAGARGDLGDRIARALVLRGAAVHALVRAGTSWTKLNALSALGADAVTVDYDDPASLERACGGGAWGG